MVLNMIVLPGCAEGLFAGLVPTPSPTPVPTSTPIPTPTPEPIPITVQDGDLQAALSGTFDTMTVSSIDGNTVLTIANLSYSDCISVLQSIDPALFRSVSYDTALQTLTFTVSGSQQSSPTRKPVPQDNNSRDYCPDCIGGQCFECGGTGYVYCNAYGCLGGSCMVCFGGYVTESYGLDIREVRCRTCGGDEECNACRGTGEVKCSECINGKCSTCRGDGYIND